MQDTLYTATSRASVVAVLEQHGFTLTQDPASLPLYTRGSIHFFIFKEPLTEAERTRNLTRLTLETQFDGEKQLLPDDLATLEHVLTRLDAVDIRLHHMHPVSLQDYLATLARTQSRQSH